MPNKLVYSHEIPKDMEITIHKISFQVAQDFKCYCTKNDMCGIGDEIEAEKNELLERFITSSEKFIKLCDDKGIWADCIDPTSGVPQRYLGSSMCYDIDLYQTLRGYSVMDAGMCQVILHPKWGTHMYTTEIFCEGEVELITEFIQESFIK